MIGRIHPVIIWMERMSSSSSPKKPMPTGLGIRKGRREQVTITIAPDILDRVDERAARMGLSRAAWINTCIFQGLEAGFTGIKGERND